MKKRILFPVLLTIVFSLLFIFTSCGYSCTTCHDEFRIVCPDCDEIQSHCSLCGGDGRMRCVWCLGTGERACIVCAGMGSRLEYDFYSKMYVTKLCYNCLGGRRVSCLKTSVCSCVEAKINCNTCSGQGNIDCLDCSPETTDAQ